MSLKGLNLTTKIKTIIVQYRTLKLNCGAVHHYAISVSIAQIDIKSTGTAYVQTQQAHSETASNYTLLPYFIL